MGGELGDELRAAAPLEPRARFSTASGCQVLPSRLMQQREHRNAMRGGKRRDARIGLIDQLAPGPHAAKTTPARYG